MTARALVRVTLWSKLFLFTTMIVVLACSAQGWFFMQEQTAVVTDGLIDSGIGLARHLAIGNRHSILISDSARIREQIAGLLTIPHVAYVVVRTQNGGLLAAAGNGDWGKLFADQRVVDLLSLRPRLPQDFVEPVVRPLRLDRDAPLFMDAAPSLLNRLPKLLLSRRDLEIGYFDIALPVLSPSATYDDDPALSLTLEETAPESAAHSIPSKVQLGTVQVGLSDVHAVSLLRSLVLQALSLTILIIVFSTVGVLYLARRISAPIKSLTSAALRLEAGDYSAKPLLSSSDEIGDLTRTFSSMVRSLEQHEQVLQEVNQTLDKRVHARTTELQQANLRLQELNHLKTTLVSSASHELRTPITAISVHLSNLLDGVGGPITPRQHSALHHIQDSTQRLRRMVDDLLDLSRLQGHRTPFVPTQIQLHRIIQDTLLTFSHDWKQKGLLMHVDVSTSLSPVWGDGDRLRQLFANLLHNAIKFSPQGGDIRVTVTSTDTTVTVCITDSGFGIPSDELDRIFLPFYRCPNGVHARGSGLGLSIVKELVDLHGGTIRVESIVGTGSRFFVELPINAHTSIRQDSLTNTAASSTSLSASVTS